MFYSKLTNLSFRAVFNLTIPSRPTKEHIASLGKLGCDWPCLAITNQKHDLHNFTSLVAISMKDIDWFPSEILMIKESCYMIGCEIILVY